MEDKVMDDDEFERTIDAGAELYSMLGKLLRSRGLGDDCGPNVMVCAMGAILATGAASLGQLVDGMTLCMKMWNAEEAAGGVFDAKFDPPHRSRN